MNNLVLNIGNNISKRMFFCVFRYVEFLKFLFKKGIDFVKDGIY